jgi:NADPH-dependent 2,4-dienoyl-CoA reductase/sulfur reductase-like enzyme
LAENAVRETETPVLIVGASTAGVRTAQALRHAGYAGALTLVGEEPHHPYDKTPLSKEMLADDGDAVPRPLLEVQDLADLDVDLRLGVRATALDVDRRLVHTEDGEALGYEHLVIATGADARQLPGSEGMRGVYTMRRVEDAMAVRSQMAAGRRAVVVGAGFIGAEFAAAARLYGMDVTLVEPQAVPLSHVLGEDVGAELSRLHAINDVTLCSGTGVASVQGDGQVRSVTLSDGRELPADLVVVGIGAAPATSWLEGSGLPLDNGVVCDDRLRVLGHEDMHAAGDVARWQHPWYGLVRIEHWTNAQEHALLVAADLCGKELPAATAPYVWSDQYGRRIQIVGRPPLGQSVEIEGSVLAGSMTALYGDADGRLVGAVVVDDPRLLLKARRAITQERSVRQFRDEFFVAR